MSITEKKEVRASEKFSGISEVTYTICPVLVASHVVAEKGWFGEELKKIGVKVRYLYSLSPENWINHFTHGLPNLFRDGGNSPAIWAKSNGVDTKLIGLTYSRRGGEIIVRADSDITNVDSLRGRKIGLTKRINSDRIDFPRYTAERDILLALDIHGLKRGDVEIVDLPERGSDYVSLEPAQKPSERGNNNLINLLSRVDVEALLKGEVDAIHSARGRTYPLEEQGKVKVIEDLGRYPDWTLQLANGPSAITVNTDLSRNYPEIVVAYLKAVIKAGRWINSHPVEAAEIFAKVSIVPNAAYAIRELAKFDLVPSLSGKNIAGIEISKKFLLEHDYITNDFDLQDWIDDSFLEEALK